MKKPSDLCHRRDNCRLCGSSYLKLVLELTPTPLANEFVPQSALHLEQLTFPLELFLCNDCKHVQLLDVVDPHVMFERYVYVSGTSPVFVKHFQKYAKMIVEGFLPDGHRNAQVLDIGSNDGTLLSCFKDLGIKVLGVDPARDIATDATERGLETIAEFFSPALANRIRKSHGMFDLITANNVFAHADDLSGIVAGLDILLSKNGVFVFEVSYLVDVYEKCLFDTIYHEHLAYHTVGPLRNLFGSNDFELIDTLRIKSHGGSLRGAVQRKGGPYSISESVEELITMEKNLGLDTVQTFVSFSDKINKIKFELMNLLSQIKEIGANIAAFGAPAKATTLMYHFGIGPDIIEYIVDDSPLKQDLYTPGLHIPVLPSDTIYSEKPDYVLILAWNFADSIIEKHQKFIDKGGKFIVPLPQVKVL
tara:strand:+ start:4 stop:1263 length:1260 start_codon:yes stop_codon:yes gene_type:complete